MPKKNEKSANKKNALPAEKSVPEKKSDRKNTAAAAKSTPKKFDESNPYYSILNQVVDPELGVGIADMGLIYDVREEPNGLVKVTMTLTSMGCPAGPELTTDVDGVLRLEKNVKDVEIEIVWEPAWNPDMMKPEIKEMLFGN